MSSRKKVIQTFLNFYSKPTYLEVGVSKGLTFHSVTAHKKIAVDPKFIFDVHEAKRLSGAEHTEYHEVTSDHYFGNVARADEKFHVIFLDGLHTFEQTLRDLINALNCIHADGIIIIDDVLPTSYHASLPDQRISVAVRSHLKDNDPSWMGDVYKLVFFVQSFFQQHSYATTSDNHGQLVIWPERRAPDKLVERNIEYFSKLEFTETIISRTAFNLMPLVDIAKRIESSLSRLLPVEGR